MKKLILLISFVSFGLASDFYFEYGKKVFIKEKLSQASDKIQEYITEDDKKIKFKNEIIVQCEENMPCLKDIQKLGLKDISKLSSNVYLVKLNDKQNIFEFSQKLYTLSSVGVAHPNFIKKRRYR